MISKKTAAALPHLLSVSDLANYLGVPPRTIYTWRYKGVAPKGFYVGKHLRFREDDVLAWLETRETGSNEELLAML